MSNNAKKSTSSQNYSNSRFHLEGSNFLQDFNPAISRREKNKRKVYSEKPQVKLNTLYDELGRIRMTREDICDCFDVKCPGCHYPCDSCSSTKCGIKCRVNRKWAYETIEQDGKDVRIVNNIIRTASQGYHGP